MASLGSRLKEERLRLRLNQTDLAALAGASKAAQINWEKDVNSPPASALTAYAQAGADVLYIVTGKRLPAVPDISEAIVREDLDRIERDLINPAWVKMPHEGIDDAEHRIRSEATNKLTDLLEYEQENLPPELVGRATALLRAVCDPKQLSILRAADFAQARQRREHEKELLEIWLDQVPYQPDHAVMETMARIVVEYGVPHGTMVELANQIYTDIEEQRIAQAIIKTNEEQART